MPVLVTLGNLNQYTFANSIIAANWQSKQLFGYPLTSIEVFHSSESREKLNEYKYKNEDDDWSNHLKKYNISEDIMIPRTIEEVSSGPVVERFVSNLESIISNSYRNDDNVLIDLTNGTTLSKNLLSIASYVLGIKNTYLIDISRLSELTEERRFLSEDLLKKAYIKGQDTKHVDNVAYLNLAEVIRYKNIIEDHSSRYEQMAGQYADTAYFRSSLEKSIGLKLEADYKKDNTIYRIASVSVSGSAEEIIDRLLDQLEPNHETRMMGPKLEKIRAKIEEKAPDEFDIEFFRKFNDFILYLRNSSTHKGKILTDLEKFKADLSVQMAFPFIQFYTDVLYPMLLVEESKLQPPRIMEIEKPEISKTTITYYGLDGDDTGKVLEELFFLEKNVNHFKQVSGSVKQAIANIRKQIIEQKGKGAIIFEAGDDLLFTGEFSIKDLESFQQTYRNGTSGMTCSIGYGNSLREVYLALKRAKSKPGKNSICGIRCSIEKFDDL